MDPIAPATPPALPPRPARGPAQSLAQGRDLPGAASRNASPGPSGPQGAPKASAGAPRLLPLPPMPKAAQRLYRRLSVQLQEDVIDRALGAVGADPLAGAPKGKDKACSISEAVWDQVGRLAFELTPKERWRHDFPFYVGGLSFVLRSHGPMGLQYAQDAAFFLRQPMDNLARLRLIFTLGWAPAETMDSMHPLIGFCLKHQLVGAALPAIFDSLSTVPDPKAYARYMLQAIEAPGAALGRLAVQTMEMWLFVASGLPAPYGDLSWLSFAAKAVLYTLSDLERTRGAHSDGYVMGCASLMQVLLFSPQQRVLTLRLFAPLHGQQMAYGTVADILTTLGQLDDGVRLTALLVLNTSRRRASNAPELCRRVKLANLAAQAAWMLHTSEPP